MRSHLRFESLAITYFLFLSSWALGSESPDFCDFIPTETRMTAYDFPQLPNVAQLTNAEAETRFKSLFNERDTVFRSVTAQSRAGGKVSSDTMRAQIPLAVNFERGRFRLTVRNQIRSLSYDVDASGNRMSPPTLNERTYDNNYEIWRNDTAGESGEWIGFMTTTGDTSESSTRGVSVGKAYFLTDGSFVWDSSAPHPSLYRVKSGERVPGLSLTRSRWFVDPINGLIRSTTSLTFPVDPRTMRLTSNQPTIERFCDLVSQRRLIVQFPDPSKITAYSDATERNGGTTFELRTLEGSTRFSGNLIGLMDSTGRRLGFAGIRAPLVLLPMTEDLFLDLENLGQATVIRAVLRTKNKSIPGIDGQLTYQIAFELPASGAKTLPVKLADVIPSVRGRNVDRNVAPAFRPEDVEEFGIEVRATDQRTDATSAHAFDLKFRARSNASAD